jgi:single-strand DNA-binding protein
LDRGTGEWRDGDTLFVGVSCWRGLGENVLKSLHKGDPVTVTGRLSVHAYTSKDGQERTSVEVEAISVGHDLNRGTTVFTKRRRQDSAAAEETRGEEALGAAEPAA